MKRKLALMLVVSLILSLGAFSTVSFAEEIETHYITSGDNFKTTIEENLGDTFIIQNDIVLPKDYASIEGFYGTLKGAEDGVSITFSNNIPLFKTFGAGTTNVSNLVLNGEGISSSTNASNVGTLVNSITDSSAVVEINNVTNNLDLTVTGRRLAIGGIVGFVQNATVSISNCKNNGTIYYCREHTVAGGILGGASAAKSIEIINCINNGDITYYTEYTGTNTPTGSYLGGIYGGTKVGNTSGTASDVFKITGCANFGDMYGSSQSTEITAGGIVGMSKQMTISKCFNAGAITSSYQLAGGILAAHYAATYTTVSDCFNTGVVTNCNSTISYNVVRSACGVATAHDNYTDYLIVKNCYNVGDMSRHSDAKTESTDSTYAKQITNSTNENTENIYSLKDTTNYKNAGGILPVELTREELAEELPTGFDKNVWEYVETSETNKYSLPQIKGNTFVTTADTWYVAPVEEPTFVTPQSFSTAGTSVYDSFTSEEITTPYSIVVTKFTLPESVTEYTFGMLLSEENLDDKEFTAENSIIAEGKKQYEGAFGILFYGNKFKDNTTYYARPYVEINGTYTYGASSPFVFNSAE